MGRGCWPERGGAALRQLDTERGPPLGILEDFSFLVERDRLEPDSVLLLYTDGLTEAQDAAGTLYSTERTVPPPAPRPAGGARTIVDACFKAVASFVGDAEQADDITLLAIRCARAAV